MLTERENDVFKLLIQGKTNKQIADELNITHHTVKAHIEHIYEKNNVHSRIELILKNIE